jgi:penicillin-binding protein 1B
MSKKRNTHAEHEAEAEPSPVYRGRKYVIDRPAPVVIRKRRLLLKLLIPLVLIGIIVLPILTYYYNRYSELIDKGLEGKIFERSTGIYAAPLHLVVNGQHRQANLIRHLQDAGYVQQGPAPNDTRGRFTISGNTVEITPGSEAIINNAKAFPAVRVVFGSNGYGIASLMEMEKRQDLREAWVEPEKISSTINKDREKRKNIVFKELPKSLVDAIVAAEDRSFFDHSGISLRGIMRAFFRNAEAGEITEGGSTITQQLVKSFFLTPEQTFKRKISEAYMAIIMERKLNKEKILEMYCNQIYLGQRGGFSINGFGEAARTYFGKDVNYLTLAESATLAGLIHSPNFYSPPSQREAQVESDRQARAINRRNTVLDLMVEQSKIKPEEAANAKLQPLGIIGRGSTDASDAPYFVDYALRQLDEKYREDSQSLRSLRIYTTVDLELQRAAYAAVQKNMPEIDRQVMARRGRTNGLQVALAAVNAKTGEVLAMVGGRDYTSSQLNRATEAKRQPGSVFKPFVYAAGLSEGAADRRITAASIYRDEPRGFDFDGKFYSPDNFKDSYEMRAMTVREALYKSKNVITVSIAERVGYSQVSNFASSAGLPNVLAVPSTALGTSEVTPLQMASAYTSFANQGKRTAPLLIKRLTTKDGSIISENATQENGVMSPQVAYIMTSMMQDVLTVGTGTRVRQMGFTAPAAGKTGSSRDGWFAGYTPNLVCVVWIGFDNNEDIGVTGGSTAALVWADFMMRALAVRPELGGDFEIPAGLVTAYVTPQGAEATPGTPGARQEIFLSGTQTGEAQDLTPVQPMQPVFAGQPGQQPIPDSTGPIVPRPSNQPTPYPPPPGAPPIPQGLAGRTNTASGADTMIPLPPEARGRVTLSQPTPQPTATPDNRSAIRRAADRVFGKSQPAPTPTGTAVIPRSTPKPSPTPAQAVRQTPPSGNVRITTAPTVGPTPWPAPKTNAAAKPTPDSGTRPRRIPTPTPTPAPKKPEVKAVAKEPKAKASPTPKPVAVTPTPVATPAQTNARKQFNFEVCGVTGLIPVKGVCQTRVRKSFFLGEEPTRTCSADKHK